MTALRAGARPAEDGRVPPAAAAVLDVDGLDRLVELLVERGYTVVAPTVRDGAVVHERIRSAAELPVGIGDEQGPGRYRLRRRDDTARFGFAQPASSWKRVLRPPELPLWTARRDERGDLAVETAAAPSERYALLGVRACELAAIAVLDRVLLAGRTRDAAYDAARRDVLVIAVNCGDPSGVCFCASAGTGPRAGAGADLVLTELLGEGGHRFLAETGSDAGVELLAALPARPAADGDRAAADRVVERAAARMGRHLDVRAARDIVGRSAESPRWEAVAQRCLACGNCTMACPTCFCTDLVDADDAAGTTATRTQRWASCFSLDFSYIHGGSVRRSTAARYRQWMTHKLSTWWDQFGTSGCVGCGRCIAWCPVGIDITEEVAALASGGRAGGTDGGART